jgi:hypothetical protein
LGVDAHDLSQFLGAVETKMFMDFEEVAHRIREEGGSCRGADEREGLQLHRDGTRVDALAEYDVDAEIFRCRSDELLHFTG